MVILSRDIITLMKIEKTGLTYISNLTMSGNNNLYRIIQRVARMLLALLLIEKIGFWFSHRLIQFE